MTVSDLVRKLQAYDGGLRVVTRGFDESNFEDLETVRVIKIKFHDENQKFHGGRHKESADNGTPALFVDWE
jgi:hypothetical protein